MANELEGYRQDRAMKQAEGIYEILKNIFKISNEEKIPTNIASNKLVEQRLQRVGGISKIFSGAKGFSRR